MTERKHILVAAHAWYGDVIGGSFRLASEFAESLSERGHRVSYLCCREASDASSPERVVTRGVEVHRYQPPAAGASRWARMRHHVRESARLAKFIAAEQPVDVLSGHSPLQFLGAALELRSSPAFNSFVVHSPFDDELLSNSRAGIGWRARLAACAARWVDRRCLALADRVQTDSRYTLDAMIKKHGAAVQRKGVVAPGWVDVQRFQPATCRRRLREQLGSEWDFDGTVFFTLRRLEARMGLDTLIDAAARIAPEQRPFRVLIGGSGPLRDSLETRAKSHGVADRVRFLGRIAEEQLPHCYAAADCFILPTRVLECFGLIVLESFAAGTPVIASNVAAIPELAGVQGNEWLFPAEHAGELADRMVRFLEGSLRSTADLRSFAESYDRPLVSRHWEVLTAPRSTVDQTANLPVKLARTY